MWVGVYEQQGNTGFATKSKTFGPWVAKADYMRGITTIPANVTDDGPIAWSFSNGVIPFYHANPDNSATLASGKTFLGEIIAGSHDTAIRTWLGSAPGLFMWTYIHEPENNLPASTYCNMVVKCAALTRAVRATGVPVYFYTQHTSGYFNHVPSGLTSTSYDDAFMVADGICIDPYGRAVPYTPNQLMDNFLAKVASINTSRVAAGSLPALMGLTEASSQPTVNFSLGSKYKTKADWTAAMLDYCFGNSFFCYLGFDANTNGSDFCCHDDTNVDPNSTTTPKQTHQQELTDLWHTKSTLYLDTANPFPQPTLSGATISLSPQSGNAAGGDFVTITATSGAFTGASVVTWAGATLSQNSNASTKIVVTTPAHVAGNVKVKVTTGGVASNVATFTYKANYPPPPPVNLNGTYFVTGW